MVEENDDEVELAAEEPAGKRRRVTPYLNDEQEESMVEWLIDNPVIYNKKMRNNYKP